MAINNFSVNGVDLDNILIRRDFFRQTNSLWSWGRNYDGMLGDSNGARIGPVQINAGTGGTTWKKIATGWKATGGIKTDGTLWTWGTNAYGQLGDNTTIAKSSPVQTIASGSTWKDVACAAWVSAGIKSDGSLWTWGRNTPYGHLGDGTVINKSSPVLMAGPRIWKSVAVADSFVVGIKTDNTLWTWGANYAGQLGDNTIIHRSSPVQTVAGGTNWKQVVLGGLSSGSAYAIKTDGTLWTWGYNQYGQLGVNDTTHRSSPVQTVAGGTNWSTLAGGSDTTAAIKTDGSLWTWGRGLWGQLGNNTITHRSSPIQTVAGGNNWRYVSSSGRNISAIKTDGTLWSWGLNNYSQLGDATTISRSSPVVIGSATNWKAVACAAEQTYLLSYFDTD